jgi:hypothetical protein
VEVAHRARDRGRQPRGRRLAGLPRRLVAGVLIGVGTIFGAKAERDQHWSIPPTMVSDAADQEASADGDDPDGLACTSCLPACA